MLILYFLRCLRTCYFIKHSCSLDVVVVVRPVQQLEVQTRSNNLRFESCCYYKKYHGFLLENVLKIVDGHGLYVFLQQLSMVRILVLC